MSLVVSNLFERFAQNRRAVIVGSIAAAFAGLGALRYVLMRSLKRDAAFSRTAEIACLCRYVPMKGMCWGQVYQIGSNTCGITMT